MRLNIADVFGPKVRFVRDVAIFLLAVPTLLALPSLAPLVKKDWEDSWFKKV